MSPSEINEKLEELYSTIQELGARIGAPREWLPSPNGDTHSRLHIEFREADDGDDEDGYWIFVTSDSDGPWVCIAECDVAYSDHLLYKLFEGIAHNLAMALRRPGPSEDPRRSLFETQERLLAMLSPEWAMQTAARHVQILNSFPFRDA